MKIYRHRVYLLLLQFYVTGMDNLKVPIGLWNVRGQRYRTDNGAESWNSQLSSIIGRNDPKISLFVKMLKEEAQKVSFHLITKDLREPGQKGKKIYARQDERMNNITNTFDDTTTWRSV